MIRFVETSLCKVHHKGVFRCIFERRYRFFFSLPTSVNMWEKTVFASSLFFGKNTAFLFSPREFKAWKRSIYTTSRRWFESFLWVFNLILSRFWRILMNRLGSDASCCVVRVFANGKAINHRNFPDEWHSHNSLFAYLFHPVDVVAPLDDRRVGR